MEGQPSKAGLWARLRGDFVAGLAILMPAVISVGVLAWLFGNVSGITENLLFFLPANWTHSMLGNGELGPMYWYWSWVSLLLTAILLCLIGHYGRYYMGRKTIQVADQVLMRVPLLNKIYGTVKQVNESFSTNKSSFQQVVLVSFPHPRSRSVGFVTGEQTGLGREKWMSVFIPTTPNPTSGFLVLVPESEVVKLDISVADGIKFVVSLGVISPGGTGHSISVIDGRPVLQPAMPAGPPALP